MSELYYTFIYHSSKLGQFLNWKLKAVMSLVVLKNIFMSDYKLHPSRQVNEHLNPHPSERKTLHTDIHVQMHIPKHMQFLNAAVEVQTKICSCAWIRCPDITSRLGTPYIFTLLQYSFPFFYLQLDTLKKILFRFEANFEYWVITCLHHHASIFVFSFSPESCE